MTQTPKQTTGGTEPATTTVKPFPARPEAEREAPAAAAPATPKKSRKKLVFGVIGLLALSAAGYYGYNYWTTGRFMVETDDAYLQADISLVSSRIQGYVSAVNVVENQSVKAGDVLLTLDDGDYTIALATAQNKLVTLQETLKRIDAQEHAAEATVAQAVAAKQAADATLRNATTTVERTRELAQTRVASQASLDDAEAALDTAKANQASAEAQIAIAEANVAVIRAERVETAGSQREMELAVKQAQRDLDLTKLRAPFDGVITNTAMELGDLVSAGTRLAAVVPTNDIYIEAYFKETQLSEIGVGAKAHVTIDAIEDKSFEGEVTSIAPATGGTFSLLPADNATGNFTKVVQRVAVRIALPAEAMADHDLRAGLSAVVEIDSRTKAAE
ncbi:HlyD family secretion protein [Phaeovulum sp. W22_SRMD_FR3]|uniref:HlyD family secretion protein n=1 Tax=Phaeovulum sp. W22_SRMD_FR3 TaxID=3240274 RepID=UPI003F9D20E7